MYKFLLYSILIVGFLSCDDFQSPLDNPNEAKKISIVNIKPTKGKPGDTVLIYGNNFQNESKVFFNNTESTIYSINDTTIKTLVPYKTSSGYVYLLNSKDTIKSPIDFVIEEVPALRIESLIPGVGYEGQNVSVFLNSDVPSARRIEVYFNGTKAEIISLKNNIISTKIPPKASTGLVTVTIDSINISSPFPFKILNVPTYGTGTYTIKGISLETVCETSGYSGCRGTYYDTDTTFIPFNFTIFKKQCNTWPGITVMDRFITCDKGYHYSTDTSYIDHSCCFEWGEKHTHAQAIHIELNTINNTASLSLQIVKRTYDGTVVYGTITEEIYDLFIYHSPFIFNEDGSVSITVSDKTLNTKLKAQYSKKSNYRTSGRTYSSTECRGKSKLHLSPDWSIEILLKN